MFEHTITLPVEPFETFLCEDGTRTIRLWCRELPTIESKPAHLRELRCEQIGGARYARRRDRRVRLHPVDWVLLDTLNRAGGAAPKSMIDAMKKAKLKGTEKFSMLGLKTSCSRLNLALSKLGYSERIFVEDGRIVIRLQNS